MANVQLILEYDGAGFHGWQKQPELRTIQGELERVLKLVLKEPVGTIYAAGRTDAGVHARGQVVNFAVETSPNLERLIHSISSLLKGELSVVSARLVEDNFNAQRDARAKQYSYSILYRRAPAVIERGKAWHISSPLDLARMQREACLLQGEHDFSSFRDSGCTNRSPVKKIYYSKIVQSGDLVIFRIVGSGFLKQMVRSIVGTLVGFGRGAMPHSSIADILALKDRTAAGITAPAHGLCMDWVAYDDSFMSELERSSKVMSGIGHYF